MIRQFCWVILIFGILTGIIFPAQAQEEVSKEPTEVNYTIGGTISFETRVLSETALQKVWVFVHPEGDVKTIVGSATLHPSNVITYKLELAEYPIRPYSKIEFWYKIIFDDGREITTNPETFLYFDNRFAWQNLEKKPFEIFWYDGDIAFGQQILNTAQEGIKRLQNYVSAVPPTDVQIYVYANASELQTALRLSGQTAAWVAGHADPDLGVVVVSIPPGPAETYEIKRQIPHEVAHVALYQWLGEEYYNLPQWYREGLPSMAELFPNPDYALLLENAYENESLLSMDSLCVSFPPDASNFLLAYAQSADFTWYLYENFGRSGLDELIRVYADGLSCAQGMEVALGKSLEEIELEWRKESFGENTLFVELPELLPWVVLMGVVLGAPILMIFSERKKVNHN